MAEDTPDPVLAHYGTDSLVDRVAQTLRQAGFGEGVIDWQALAPLDQFHVGGAAATASLAAKLGVTPGAGVLDVGCGLGGPSRHLAALHDCTVTGIDLSRPFVDVATMLTARTGQSDRVRHLVGDATDLPFEPETFGFAWSQHVAMNIADRQALYGGIHRVLRPGGRFALYDVVAGAAGPLHFPVPWARDPAASFLLAPDATRAILEAVGFTVLEWIDATSVGLEWFQAQAAASRGRPDHHQPLALKLIMGDDFPAMTANLGQNLREGRARLLQAVLQR